MGLVLQFTIGTQSSCQGIIFTETTGAYSSPSNTGGWGTPNPATSAATSSYLTIQNLTTSTTYDNINITPSSSDTSTTILTSGLSVNGVFLSAGNWPDGLYYFTYTVVITEDVVVTTYQQTLSAILLCNVICKLKTMATQVDLDCGCCNQPCNQVISNFLEAYTLYKAIVWAGTCGSQSQINDNINSLEFFLINSNCDTC